MGESSVMVSLAQMVDLALGSPEPGAVNFNVLHSLLHVLIQQVELVQCQVEFRGNDSERIQHMIATSKPGPTINLTEYIVTPGKEQRKVVAKKTRLRKRREDGKEGEVLVERELKVIDQRRDSKEQPSQTPTPLTSARDVDGSEVSMQTVVVVEANEGDNAPHVSVALSRAQFTNLEDEIERLKDEIRDLKELPANSGLLEALRSGDKSSPVVDMFQILSLTRRIEAAEEGMSKLGSMIEDIVREGLPSPDDFVPFVSSQADKATGTKRGGAKGPENLEKRVTQLEISVNALVAQDPALAKTLAEAGVSTSDKASGKTSVGTSAVPSSKGAGTGGAVGGGVGVGVGGGGPEQVKVLESRLTEYTEQIATLDTMFNNQINMLQSQFNELEKEIGEIVERINAGLRSDAGDSELNMAEIYKRLDDMQGEMQQLQEMVDKILQEKETGEKSHMDVLMEQIELLKTIKANREDLEDALADKADACAVNRKVSHAQFDAACEDLAHGIEDALKKLTQQEQLWQQALDDIQREIESKLDKMELTPLRDFVNNKLKSLQERVKALANLKMETEAAGTKSKLLRNVNCISCDKDVVMRKQMDTTMMAAPPALPPTKSMGPYLAYELDALRKQQKCMPNSRNMNHFEIAISGNKSKGEDHICNRYCGGSHTTTTPQQRVARLGHFLQQWGPESQSASEGQIKGTDGQMYKSRDTQQLKNTAMPTVEEEPYIGMASRPSMMVQGGILTSRSNVKGKEEDKLDQNKRSSSVTTQPKIATAISFKHEDAPEGA